MIWLWIDLIIIFVFAVLWFGFLDQKISVRSKFVSNGKFQPKNIKARKILSNLILILILIDACCTLIGQPDIYWKDYSRYWEANPLAIILLKWHPLAFVLCLLFWALISNCFIRFLSRQLAQLCFLTLFIAHSLAIFSWLPVHGKYFFYFQCLFCFSLALVLLILINKFFSHKNP